MLNIPRVIGRDWHRYWDENGYLLHWQGGSHGEMLKPGLHWWHPGLLRGCWRCGFRCLLALGSPRVPSVALVGTLLFNLAVDLLNLTGASRGRVHPRQAVVVPLWCSTAQHRAPLLRVAPPHSGSGCRGGFLRGSAPPGSPRVERCRVTRLSHRRQLDGSLLAGRVA